MIGAALVLLWLLNLDDVLLTRRALPLGAVEANAIMGQFLRLGFVPAALIKMAVVTAGAVFLWSQRRRAPSCWSPASVWRPSTRRWSSTSW